ncbi:Signal transduction histidine kinase [Filimonas lacunae]|uniref:histidine kinase n=1 Tax=Filimonas lacunae TaxID=477680 RepID=A0A173MDT3_9BACT|nr:ATP-binding protein [Filimonas lacunae]BAV05639.1 two-component sensor histidine kinase [Filimonas lacunae]SIT29096.1 Signal transduction histidine kinase [Filimonas lacunae]
MKIRLRLTLLFTFLFAAILLAFALIINFSYSENREEKFYKRLQQRAITQANLLLDAGVHPSVLQLIYRNALNEEEVAVFDTAFNLIYHDGPDIDKVKETPQMMNNILHKGEIRFHINREQAVGFLYHHKGKTYIITAAAADEWGLRKLQNLQNTLIVGFIASIILTLVAGRFFSKKALSPVSDMIEKVEDITATNLHLRVPEGNGKDEIAELAITFNHMLNRLENSFEAQKQFVSNISHELRTPLATIITELELSTIKPRTAEDYKATIALALADARKLARLSNDLLDFAKASYDQAEITFKPLRVDELLLDARMQVIKANSNYQVSIEFKEEIENDELITLNGNEYLLKVAFANLMENGCKFSSNHQCKVTIHSTGKNITAHFSDTGIGIDLNELPHIFKAFYRGSNKTHAQGNGIGLSLTERIIKLHNGHIAVQSQLQKGTVFAVQLPHL